MATNNLVSKTAGEVLIQHGSGTPDHTASVYTKYTNLDDGTEYMNTDGGTTWVVKVAALVMKSGVVTAASFTGNPMTATVTFAKAFADANYSPTVTTQVEDEYATTVSSVAAGSFVINLNSGTAPTNDVLWTAIKHGES